jgi:hypothetical protein
VRVPFYAVPSLIELMTDPLVQARGLAVTRDHEGFGPITTTAPGVKPVSIRRYQTSAEISQ